MEPSQIPGATALPSAMPLGAVPSMTKTRSPAEAREAAEGFAAFFLTQTLESMFSGIGSDALFGGGSGEGIYRSLMLQQYGKAMARAGGLGITDTVQKQILQLQETKR